MEFFLITFIPDVIPFLSICLKKNLCLYHELRHQGLILDSLQCFSRLVEQPLKHLDAVMYYLLFCYLLLLQSKDLLGLYVYSYVDLDLKIAFPIKNIPFLIHPLPSICYFTCAVCCNYDLPIIIIIFIDMAIIDVDI